MKTLKATTAGLLILLIVIAPPYLLVRYIGNPWPPEGIDLASPITDNAVLGLLAVLVWILWAQFAVSVIVEAYATVTDRPVNVRLPVFGIQQDLARALVGAVLTTIVIAPILGAAMPSAAGAPAPAANPVSTALQQSPPPARAPTTHTTPPAEQQREATPLRVHVERGDTLWSLAEKHLGDGDKWAEIAEANHGHTMVDGRVFTSADQILPGWVLRIPGAVDHGRDLPSSTVDDKSDYRVQAGDTLSAIADDKLGDPNAYPAIFAASKGITQPGGQHLADPDHIEPGWNLSIPGTDKSTDRSNNPQRKQDTPTTAATPDEPGDQQPEPTTPETEKPSPEEKTPTTPAPTVEPTPTVEAAPSTPTQATASEVDDEDETWPIKTGGGVGVVLAGLVIGLLARRRAVQRRRRKPGERLPLPDGPAEKVETQVRAVADEVGVEFVDQALGALATHTAATQTALPQLQAARMTPTQLDLYFTEAPQQGLPAPWQATSDPAVWVMPADQRHLLGHLDPELPALWPALVSVGHDAESGVILLNLAQLQGLSVTGDHHLTSQVMIALAVELGTAPWAVDLDLTVIGSLVELADVLDRGRLRYVPTSHNVRIDPTRTHVVIAMTPINDDQEAQLLERGAAVVVQGPSVEDNQQAGWTIDLVDAEHATIQPLGLQINPQRVDSATYASILEMLTTSLADPLRPGQDQVVPFHREAPDNLPPSPSNQDEPRRPGPGRAVVDEPTSRLTAGAGPDDRGAHHLGHHMVDGNTITATRTAPEPPLALVEQVHDTKTADVEEAISTTVTQPEPPSLVADQVSEQDLMIEGDIPAELTSAPAALVEPPLTYVASRLDDTVGAVGPASDAVVVEHPMIRLLGPAVEIVGTKTNAPTSESHLWICTRIATYLALNPDTTRTALIDAIWSGRRVSTSTVDSRISQLRNWLGDNPDTGETYLPRRSLRFNEAITTDWNQFVDLVGHEPTKASTEALETAVQLIRGRPLEGETSKNYGFAEYFTQDVIDILADATYELARRRYLAGEWHTAGSAAALGIRVDPSNEQLWRLRIHAAHSAGDATVIGEATDRMRTRITELGFDLDDETTELVEAIAKHDVGAISRCRQGL